MCVCACVLKAGGGGFGGGGVTILSTGILNNTKLCNHS